MTQNEPSGFDPYRIWLGISADRFPPTYYDILGIEPGESAPEVIRSAAEQRRNFIYSRRGTGHDKAVQSILQQIDDAVATLLVHDAKFNYDRVIGLQNDHPNQQPSRPLPSWFQTLPGRIYGNDDGIVTTFAGIMAVLIIGVGLTVWMSSAIPWGKLEVVKQPETTNERLIERPRQFVNLRDSTGILTQQC